MERGAQPPSNQHPQNKIATCRRRLRFPSRRMFDNTFTLRVSVSGIGIKPYQKQHLTMYLLLRRNIMCLYPRLIKNRKYMPNKKNGGNVPTPRDKRLLYVPIGCGQCIECRTQKAREWQVRLNEELKNKANAYFITLTFSNESLDKLCNELNIGECNAVAALAVRRFMERWRKKYAKSVKHWLITELGHEGTERLHLHGVLFTDIVMNNNILEKIWQYGMTYVGEYCNEKTINYIVKYVTKIDTDHRGFVGQIFCSAGLGSRYTNNEINIYAHKYEYGNTKEYYTLKDGSKVNLPIYYRNKLFDENTREKLWLERLNKHERYVRGILVKNYDTEKGEALYNSILEQAQRENEAMGYGNDSKEWQKKQYNITAHMLNKEKSGKQNAKKHEEQFWRYKYKNIPKCNVDFAKLTKNNIKLNTN